MMETLDTQVIYKLAQIETKVGEIGNQLTGVVSRLETRINTDRLEVEKALAAAKIEIEQDRAALEKRVDANEKLLSMLNKWKEAWVIRITMILSAVSLIWLLVGNELSVKIGSFLH